MTDISITAANVIAGTDANVATGTSGATVTAGQAVYLDSTDSRYKLADSNSGTAAARQPKGIALNGASAGQPIAVQTSGDITIGGTLTAGATYMLSDTPGGICPDADVGSGEYVCLLGVAKSTTVLDLAIQATGVAN